MQTVHATALKNRLGEVLARAALGPVAIQRHGRVVALLVPPPAEKNRKPAARPAKSPRWNRRAEERVVELCAQGDFRPSRWLRAGDAQTLAGVATMLASEHDFDRTRMLALAERLHPGMTTPATFNRWLARTPVHAARFLPQLAARLRAPEPAAK
ncbi:MAG: type II toxin-antitoxin system Phd/YefM family antitoxin [Pseudomonadota bacterium]|mgnify:CR=1 FL=1